MNMRFHRAAASAVCVASLLTMPAPARAGAQEGDASSVEAAVSNGLKRALDGSGYLLSKSEKAFDLAVSAYLWDHRDDFEPGVAAERSIDLAVCLLARREESLQEFTRDEPMKSFCRRTLR